MAASLGNRQRNERILAIIALVTLAAAWVLGSFRLEADKQPFLKQALPEADRLDFLGGDTYSAWKEEPETRLLGYVTTGKAPGYGGTMELVVAVDSKGEILGFTVYGHKETPSFLRRVLRSKLPKSLLGKSYQDAFVLGTDVDGVTGATYTSRALTDAIRRAGRRVAENHLGLKVPPEIPPHIRFGIPEGILLALFLGGMLAARSGFKARKVARWVLMLTGLVFLGFITSQPLTLIFINQALLGFWPQWQTHLFWYILMGGVFLLLLLRNSTPYCDWLCPFGAIQECLALIGVARNRIPARIQSALRWLPRFLAWAAIFMALLSRNPSSYNYEVFGAFFQLVGSDLQFVLLGIVLIASLFLRRPWCRYLCPLRPITDIIRLFRTWVLQSLKKPARQATALPESTPTNPSQT